MMLSKAYNKPLNNKKYSIIVKVFSYKQILQLTECKVAGLLFLCLQALPSDTQT